MRQLAGWIGITSMLVCNSSGMVLCIGDDGHLAVEPVHEEHCGLPTDQTDESHHDEESSTSFPAENNSGGCLDVPVDLDTAAYVAKDLKLGSLLNDTNSKDLVVSYMVELHSRVSSNQFLVLRSPRFQSHITQQTIVLRL